MDSALADELRALRARAYGRDADLDPAAAARLRELEAMRVRARADAADARGTTGPDPHETNDPDAGARAALLDALESLDPGASLALRNVEERADDGATDAGGTTDAADRSAGNDPDATHPASGIRRRHVALWIASLMATAVAASAVTWGIAEITPVATSSGAPQIATLEPISESGSYSQMFGGGEDSPVFEFFGLSLFRGVGAGWNGNPDAGDVCLHALATDDLPPTEEIDSGSWGLDGPMYSGCGAGSFPASLTVSLDDQLPDQLRTEFPDATAIQFVVDGDRVGVFLDEG
ncbi:hypothetical protein ACI3KS_17905 [Microbacterium sp. ZW T5_45]|uniref:hypothetical protein n=1 Tax=Microbacterium sp. ZW T5_45 TaxID=3378080 RepID=UPI00385442F9